MLMYFDNPLSSQIKSNTPVLLCSVTGYDASGRVDDLAAHQSKQCTSIAIGSAEGFNLAEKAISSASKSGRLAKSVKQVISSCVQLSSSCGLLVLQLAFQLQRSCLSVFSILMGSFSRPPRR